MSLIATTVRRLGAVLLLTLAATSCDSDGEQSEQHGHPGE